MQKFPSSEAPFVCRTRGEGNGLGGFGEEGDKHTSWGRKGTSQPNEGKARYRPRANER